MKGLSLILALIVGSRYMFTCALPLEPTCSKFDYEMKSLEAMLRTEHKVEKMLEEMKALKEATSKDLDQTKAFRETTKTEVGDLKSEMNKWLIEKEGNIEEKLETVNRKTDEKLQTIDAASQLFLNKVDAFMNSSIVTFSVTKPTQSLVNGVPTFSVVITNIGDGYDTDTGVFTSPVDGLYLFLFTVASKGKHDVYCWIKHNGQSKLFSRSYGDNSYTTATASIILMLSKGDHVSPGSCHGWTNVYTNSAPSFSGVLLKQTSLN